MKDEECTDSIVLTYDFINSSKYAGAFGWIVFTAATQGAAELHVRTSWQRTAAAEQTLPAL